MYGTGIYILCSGFNGPQSNGRELRHTMPSTAGEDDYGGYSGYLCDSRLCGCNVWGSH